MRLNRVGRCVLSVVALFVVAACGEGDAGDPGGAQSPTAGAPSPSPTRLPTLAERCGGEAPAAARPVQVASASGTLYGVEMGQGPRALLLIHGSGSRGLCVWQQELPALSGAGFRVLAVDHSCVGRSTCPTGPQDQVADIRSAVEHLRAGGATSVVVVGASAGTAQVIVAAATPTVPLTAAVALSPARLDEDVRPAPEQPRTARAAPASIRVPFLFVVAADDRLASVPDTTALHAATPRPLGTLLSLPAGGHAQKLLYPVDNQNATTPAGPVYDRVLAFLRQHSGA